MAQRRIFGPESSRSSFIEFGAVLSEIEYAFSLQWLTTVQFWQLEITDPRRQQVILGIRVVADTDMLQPFNESPRLPPGRLVAYDTTGKSQDPGRDDWIERHLFIYEEPVEEPEENFVRILPPPPS